MARFIRYEQKLEAWRDQFVTHDDGDGRPLIAQGRQHYTIDGVEVPHDEFYEALRAQNAQ